MDKFKISFDYEGCYLEHKEFFDELAKAMQSRGHEVGFITGIREAEIPAMSERVGFTPNFTRVWGDYESIGNANAWKAENIHKLGVWVHFDDDATEIKKYTDRWILKTMNNAQMEKF